MAPPSIHSSDPPSQEVDPTRRLKWHNEELERKLKESLTREERMRVELQKALARVRVAEEAEEMLCSQLGELEAEAVDQARDFQARIADLAQQLSHAQRLLGAHSISIKSL